MRERAVQWGRRRKERGVQSGGIKNQPTSAFMSVTNWTWRESGDREKCSLQSNVGFGICLRHRRYSATLKGFSTGVKIPRQRNWDRRTKGERHNARVSYPTETVLSNEITRNQIFLSLKDSPRKPLGRRPQVRNAAIRRSTYVG